MTTYVALLRGINVGGHHKVPMADLRAVVADAGWNDVTTYIQSGNVVFRGRKQSTDRLAGRLGDRLGVAFGFEVPVVVRTLDEWSSVVDRQPFPGAPGRELHVVFLRDALEPDALDHLDPEAFAPDAWVVDGRQVYLHLPDGMGRSKLAQAVTTRGPAATGTARNWNTVTKLHGLAAGLPS